MKRPMIQDGPLVHGHTICQIPWCKRGASKTHHLEYEPFEEIMYVCRKCNGRIHSSDERYKEWQPSTKRPKNYEGLDKSRNWDKFFSSKFKMYFGVLEPEWAPDRDVRLPFEIDVYQWELNTGMDWIDIVCVVPGVFDGDI